MRVLFYGLGGIGQRHLRNLREVVGPRLEVHAHRTRRLAHVLSDRLEIVPGETLEEKYGIIVHSDRAGALASRPDAVFVCNPSSMHVDHVIDALRSGAAVFVEKPLSHDWQRVAEMLAIAETSKAVGMVGYQLRFHPCVEKAIGLLSSGAIGRLVAVRMEVGEWLPGWHKYEDYRTMYASQSSLGGGVILSQIHEMDILYAILGVPEHVYCIGGKLTRLDVDVEDVAGHLFGFIRDGRLIPVQLHQDYIQRPPRRYYEFIGDAGKVEIDMLATTLTRYGAEGDVVEKFAVPDFQRNSMFLAQIRHFVDCVEGGESPRVSLEDGSQSLRMALACRLSMKEARVVRLAEVGA